MSELIVRRMTVSDAESVSRLEQEIFSQPWSRQAFLDALANENVIFFVAELSGITVGYCGMYCVLDEGEITNVAVSACCQGQGIGRKMLDTFLKEAREHGVHQVYLEVRVSNEGAIHLYRSLGFEIQGVRKNFYEMPREDGYVMSLSQ